MKQNRTRDFHDSLTRPKGKPQTLNGLMLLGPCSQSLHIGRQLISDAKREGLIDIRQVPASCAERPRQTHQDPISLMAVARAPLCAAAAFIKARASFPPLINCSARFILTSLPTCLPLTLLHKMNEGRLKTPHLLGGGKTRRAGDVGRKWREHCVSTCEGASGGGDAREPLGGILGT